MEPEQIPASVVTAVMAMMAELDRVIAMLGGDQKALVAELKRFGHTHTHRGLDRTYFQVYTTHLLSRGRRTSQNFET